MTEAIVELAGELLDAANETYAALRFVPSDPATCRTFGILAGGRPVALGRLHRHADLALEVGGFWVREDHRGQGLARRIVRHVLDALPRGAVVWCIPFTHLIDIYASFGMERVDPCAAAPTEIPASIAAKIDLCRAEHGRGCYSETALLRLET